MSKPIRKCADCRHARPTKDLNDRWSYAKCDAPGASREPPRYHLGEREGRASFCSSERNPWGGCGPSAKLFEPRTDEPSTAEAPQRRRFLRWGWWWVSGAAVICAALVVLSEWLP